MTRGDTRTLGSATTSASRSQAGRKAAALGRLPRPAVAVRPTGFELGVLLTLGLLAAAQLAFIGWHVVARGWIWTGIEGGMDQAQWVNWIRDASEHVLVRDLYRLEPSAASFLHPGVLVSGGLAALGLAPSTVYLLWKPIAVVALFFAARAYVHRTLSGKAARRAALVLALLFVWPVRDLARLVVTDAEALSEVPLASFELWPVYWHWGYHFTPIAVALMTVAFMTYVRERSSGSWGVLTPLLGLLCAWLHPLQGAVLMLSLLGAEAAASLARIDDPDRGAPPRGGRRFAALVRRAPGIPALVPTLVATAAPLVYYALLSRLDRSWVLADKFEPHWPWWTVPVTVAPLALPALLAYRLRPTTFQDVALRAGPIAGLGLYTFLSAAGIEAFPPHALQGLSIPLAILAVTGVATIPLRLRPRSAAAAAFAAVALLTVPGTALALRSSLREISKNELPLYLTPGERDALAYLDRNPSPGGVLAPLTLGQLVPAKTGRPTWVGSTFWTPNFFQRVVFTDALFDGRMSPLRSVSFVRVTGARFLVSDCRGRSPLADSLRPILTSVRRFGCATVYEVTGSFARS